MNKAQNFFDTIKLISIKNLRMVLFDPEWQNYYQNFFQYKQMFEPFTKEDYFFAIVDYELVILKAQAEKGQIDLVAFKDFCNIFLREYFLENPTKQYYNPIMDTLLFILKNKPYVKNAEEAYTYFQKNNESVIFSEKGYEQKKRLIQKYNKIIQEDMIIFDYEFQELFELFTATTTEVDSQKAVDYMMRALIMNHNTLSDEYYQKFIAVFIKQIAQEYKIPVVVKFTSIREENGKTTLGECLYDEEEKQNIIFLQERDFYSGNVLENLPTIFHEMRHALQNVNKDIREFENAKFQKDIILASLLGKKYYDDNYTALSIETDAFENMNIAFLNYLFTICPEAFEVEFEDRLEELYTYLKYKENNNRNWKGKEEPVDILFDRIVKENGKNAYSDFQLAEEYNPDGTRKLPLFYVQQLHNYQKKYKISKDSLWPEKIKYVEFLLLKSQYNETDLEKIVREFQQFKTNDRALRKLARKTYKLYYNQLEQIKGEKNEAATDSTIEPFVSYAMIEDSQKKTR